MKKIGILFNLLCLLLCAGRSVAQSLVCNDLVYVSVDASCSYTLKPEDILEGTIFSDCVVELDKVLPYGNGPWVPGVLGQADIGNTYQVRVRHLPSGNICWGNLKTEDKLPPTLSCDGITTVNLIGGDPLVFPTSGFAQENCSTATVTPNSITFDCSNLGVNTILLSASDALNNTSSCVHTVIVNSPTPCNSCVSSCPESVSVTYDVGNIDLLSAFNNSDWSPFDAFGNATFNTACSSLDSTYVVDYQVGTAGQSWFNRSWDWVDGGGQPVNCTQSIVFPTTHTVIVQGKVFLDESDDCIFQAGEQGIPRFPISITKSPSGTTNFIWPNSNGSYFAAIDFDVLDDGADLNLVLPPGVNPVCPSAFNVPNSTATPAYQFDMGVQSEGSCPQLQVDLGNLFIRRCATRAFKIQYCNNGLDTAQAAFLTLDLDSLIVVESADLPYTVSGPEVLYTFQLGDVPPFFCGEIVVNAFTSCDAELGQTLCSEVHIYPDTICDGPWQGAELEATAQCTGDSISLTLRNKGIQDMTVPLEYIVVEDFIMYKQESFQLHAGESVILKTEANGATWRIEAPQVPGFPTPGLVAAGIEGCGGINIPGVLNAYGQNDNSSTYDQDCSVVVGSCDPNDKNAVPIGYSEQHFIRANQVIEYKIRFQNTGTDTAFRVVIVDTLSALLDARSLEAGASSHPYRLEIFTGGIVHFVFDPIALPDSNVNEVNSHGYVEFRIAQQPDLPDGTLLENEASIYFDQNDAVLTNTAFHTIGYPFVPNLPITYSTEISQPSCHSLANGAIQIEVTGGITPYHFLWNEPNVQGNAPTGLQAGTYQVSFTDSYHAEFVQTFELSDPEAIEMILNSTPTTGNENNGTATASASGGTGGFTYLWSNGAVTEALTGLEAGLYTLTVSDANGCTQSGSVEVLKLVGTKEQPDLASKIKAWPNPAHDELMLDLREVLPQLVRMDLFNAEGRLLHPFQPKELQGLIKLDLSDEPTSGFYMLVLHDLDGNMVTKKIIIQ